MAANGKGPSHSNLFVGSIAEGTTEDALKTAFAAIGGVESATIISRNGRTNGFVKMADVDAATKAVAALNGSNGWEVKFANYDIGQAPKWNQKGGMGKYGGYGWFPAWGKGGFSFGGWTFQKGGGGYGYGDGYGKGSSVPELREDPPDTKPEPPKSNNLYVKHLPIGVTEDNLKETFSSCGEVQEVKLLRPSFALEYAALVRFVSDDAAEKARNELDGTVVKGSPPALYANTQTKRNDSQKDHVYIRNVPTNTSDEKIKEIVGRSGTIKWSKVMRAKPGERVQATCAALFEMSSEEEAQAVITALSDKTLTFGDLCGPMRVRFAENKADSSKEADDANVPTTRLAASIAAPA